MNSLDNICRIMMHFTVNPVLHGGGGQVLIIFRLSSYNFRKGCHRATKFSDFS